MKGLDGTVYHDIACTNRPGRGSVIGQVNHGLQLMSLFLVMPPKVLVILCKSSGQYNMTDWQTASLCLHQVTGVAHGRELFKSTVGRLRSGTTCQSLWLYSLLHNYTGDYLWISAVRILFFF